MQRRRPGWGAAPACSAALALLLARPAAAQQPGADLVQQAESALERRDYPAARSLLQQLVQKQPRDPRLWYDLGYADDALGQPDAAIDAYRHSVQLDPALVRPNLNLGLLLAQRFLEGSAPDPALGREAEGRLHAALEVTPDQMPAETRVRALAALAQVQASVDPSEAGATAERVLQLAPGDAIESTVAGQVFEKIGQNGKAEQAYRAALKAGPAAADAAARLATLLLRENRAGEAHQVALSAKAAGVSDPALDRVLLRTADATGSDAGSLETALRARPGDETLEQQLAAAYVAGRRYPEAANLYATLLARHPDDANLMAAYGKVLLEEHRFPQAQASLQQAVARRPDDGGAWGDLALAASENGDPALALRALEHRAKYLPETPGTHFLRATSYDKLHDYRDASESYRRFLAVAAGRFPDEEWKARHRLKAIDHTR